MSDSILRRESTAMAGSFATFRSYMDALESGPAEPYDVGARHTKGENGADALTAAGVGDPRVALFYRAVRGARREDLRDLCDAIFERADKAASKQERASIVADLVVLMFQTRDIQEGKGERSLFFDLIFLLDERLPKTIEASLPLIVTGFGSFRDLRQLIADLDGGALGPNGPAWLPACCRARLAQLKAAALQIFVTALRADSDALARLKESDVAEKAKGCSKLSLAAKWAPREGCANSKIAKELAGLIFPGAADSRRQYRKLVAGLNSALGTVEVKMAGGDWDKIEPGSVPARCLTLKRAAFTNVVARSRDKGQKRSEDPVRVKCAEAFTAHAQLARKDPTKARMHGANMQPHELVNKYIHGYNQEEDDIIEAQWVDLRENLKTAAKEAGGGGLGSMIPLVDVSGSMSGTPMEVAIALGLLVAEMTHPAFRDRMITFESSPRWHKLPEGSESLKSRVESAAQAPWGGSTNFQAAMELILKTCVDENLPPELVGSLTLTVFSDMQFDQAVGGGGYGGSFGGYGGYYGGGSSGGGSPSRGWESHYQALTKAFARAGQATIHKKAYPVPQIVFWNLRGDTQDYPAEASAPGVAMLGGFSASMLKLFLKADVDSMLKEQGELRLPPEERANAYDVLRKALDHKVYRPVRQVCAEVGEGPLEGYEVPPQLEEEWELVEASFKPRCSSGRADDGGDVMEDEAVLKKARTE